MAYKPTSNEATTKGEPAEDFRIAQTREVLAESRAAMTRRSVSSTNQPRRDRGPTRRRLAEEERNAVES